MREITKQILSMGDTPSPEVAKALGLTYNQVVSVRKHYGVSYKKRVQGKCTDYKLMFKLIEEGKPYPEIAKLFGLQAQSIRHHAAKIGHNRQHVLDEQAIIKAYKSKMQIKMIEVKFNCCNHSIYRILSKHGIELNRK